MSFTPQLGANSIKWSSVYVAPLESLANVARAGFPVINTIDSLSWMVLPYEGCPVRCGIFSSISDLYPLDASDIPSLKL